MLALDLFCGCGGVGLSMRQSGLQVIGIDKDREALAIYRDVVGECLQGDIAKLEPKRVWGERGKLDLLWASPPCQPWSEGRWYRSELWGYSVSDGWLLLEPARWASELEPRWVIVENVDGIPDEGLAPLTDALGRQYPYVSILRLNARDWVPQNRGHVFVVAGQGYVPLPASERKTCFADVMDGQGAEMVKPEHLRHALRKRFSTPVVTPGDVLPTVATRSYASRCTCFVMTEAGHLRYPTFLEALRAQGFPDDHPLRGLHERKPALSWRLLGNAVPVGLVRAVVEAVISIEEKKGDKE